MATILLAEDEAPLRNLIARVLTRKGYRVLSAADAEQALELATGYQGRIDLLLSDIRMPGRSGIELHQELTRRFGTIPVLFISGYAEGRSLDLPFLAKPFSPAVLVRVIQQLLPKARGKSQ